jgi:hypothetical protein
MDRLRPSQVLCQAEDSVDCGFLDRLADPSSLGFALRPRQDLQSWA